MTSGDGLVDGLVDDIVTMTRQAAVDGLPLSAVIADLRLVLDLEPTDEVPARVLRSCALAWAEVHQELAASPDGVPTRTWHELESHLWSLVGSHDEPLPGWVIEVRASAPGPSADGDLARLASVLEPVDYLRGAAQVLASFLDLPGEQVSLVREPSGPDPDRIVALVADQDERATLAQARLAALPAGGEGTLAVRVSSLADQPDGLLAALRAALG